MRDLPATCGVEDRLEEDLSPFQECHFKFILQLVQRDTLGLIKIQLKPQISVCHIDTDPREIQVPHRIASSYKSFLLAQYLKGHDIFVDQREVIDQEYWGGESDIDNTPCINGVYPSFEDTIFLLAEGDPTEGATIAHFILVVLKLRLGKELQHLGLFFFKVNLRVSVASVNNDNQILTDSELLLVLIGHDRFDNVSSPRWSFLLWLNFKVSIFL